MMGTNRPNPPEELFAEAHWYACRTRARAEKKVHRCLVQAGVESYLPLVELACRDLERVT